MKFNENLKKVKDELNSVSPSFCLAKWKQVTIHLQNGTNHSCHHPIPHKIPLKEIESNPSALHNTNFKKQQRKSMLTGHRPEECDYCWRIEDAHPDNFSDRMVKSADHWAYPHFNEVASMPWDQDIEPSYLEISFGNECQFKCAYCSPLISSAILTETIKHGAYRVQPYFDLKHLKDINQYPYSKDEVNPYVEAFWKWWPKLSKKLGTFRITGGEPLLNPNTFQFLEYIISNPMPELEVGINSNLSVPDQYIDKFINLAKQINDKGLVKKLELYTSIDTHGKQAEYIRNGLNCDKFYTNIRKVLTALPNVHLVIMCTFNALSVPRFEQFIEELILLKKEFPHFDGKSSRIQLSIPYLRYPPFMAANILPKEFIKYTEKALEKMLRNSDREDFTYYKDYEIGQLRRILEWLRSDDTPSNTIKNLRKDFYSFFMQYDHRKGTSFKDTFPELVEFYDSIEKSFAEV